MPCPAGTQEKGVVYQWERNWLQVVLCAALCLTAFAGCETAQEELQNVTLCEVTHSIFYAPQYVAMELGFFEEEGLSVELSNGGGAR